MATNQKKESSSAIGPALTLGALTVVAIGVAWWAPWREQPESTPAPAAQRATPAPAPAAAPTPKREATPQVQFTATQPQLPHLLANAEGDRLARLGQNEEALEEFRKAIEAKPDFARGHMNLGVVLMRLERMDEAREALEAALEHDPYLAETHAALGTLHAMESHFGGAAKHFRQALALDDAHVGAYVGLARVRVIQERYDEAAGLLRTARDLAPHDPRVDKCIAFLKRWGDIDLDEATTQPAGGE